MSIPETKSKRGDLSAKTRFNKIDASLSYSYLEATYDANGTLNLHASWHFEKG
jgi:hypothetical protein